MAKQSRGRHRTSEILLGVLKKFKTSPQKSKIKTSHPDSCWVVENARGDQWIGVGEGILIFSTLKLATDFLAGTCFKKFVVTSYKWNDFIEKISGHPHGFAILDYTREKSGYYCRIPLLKD